MLRRSETRITIALRLSVFQQKRTIFVISKQTEDKMMKIDLKQRKREVLGVIAILLIIVSGMSIYKCTSFHSALK